MHPEYGLKEQVRYIGLPKKFVAGTVILGDINDCAKGAKVTLIDNGVLKETITNGFGDFEFEDLPDNVSYNVKIEAKGYKQKSLKTKTSRDVYLGEIVLRRKI